MFRQCTPTAKHCFMKLATVPIFQAWSFKSSSRWRLRPSNSIFSINRTSRGIAARCTWPSNVHSCKHDGRLTALSHKQTPGHKSWRLKFLIYCFSLQSLLFLPSTRLNSTCFFSLFYSFERTPYIFSLSSRMLWSFESFP